MGDPGPQGPRVSIAFQVGWESGGGVALICAYSSPSLSWCRDPLAPLEETATPEGLDLPVLLVLLGSPVPLASEE